jgi:hypothetical protein
MYFSEAFSRGKRIYDRQVEPIVAVSDRCDEHRKSQHHVSYNSKGVLVLDGRSALDEIA